jgi:hypothetical protein
LSSAPSERWRPSQAFLDGTVNLASADQQITNSWATPRTSISKSRPTHDRQSEHIGHEQRDEFALKAQQQDAD